MGILKSIKNVHKEWKNITLDKELPRDEGVLLKEGAKFERIEKQRESDFGGYLHRIKIFAVCVSSFISIVSFWGLFIYWLYHLIKMNDDAAIENILVAVFSACIGALIHKVIGNK